MINNSIHETSHVYLLQNYSMYFNCIIDTDFIEQIILIISNSNITTQKIAKNKNVFNNFLFHTTHILDKTNLVESYVTTE